MSPSASTPRLTWLVALAALLALLGTGLRFYHLDRMVYWHDEAHTALRVLGVGTSTFQRDAFRGEVVTPAEVSHFVSTQEYRGLARCWKQLTGRPEHSPLYYLLASVWTRHFDSVVTGTRSLAALLSLLLLPAVYWLARELFDSSRAAWVAVALAAVSPVHLLYAQEAREYALWTALLAAASAALLRAERLGRPGAWACYAVLALLGLYTHVLFVLAMLAHGVYLFRPRPSAPRARWAFLASGAIAVLGFAPWLTLLVRGHKEVGYATSWMLRPVGLERLLEAWCRHLQRLFLDPPGPLLLQAAVCAVIAVALWRLWRGGRREARWLLAALVLVPAAPLILPDLLLGGRRSLETRYLLPGLLAVEIAVAYLLAQLWDGSRTSRLAAALAGTLLLGTSIGSDVLIAQAETWWTKSLSADNAKLARLIGAGERPLLVVHPGDVTIGEVLSLSLLLDPKVRLLLPGPGAKTPLPHGYTNIYLLVPGQPLLERLRRRYDLQPVAGTWKLWAVTPRPTVPR